MVLFYHINSHQCKTIKQKLQNKKIKYKEITDVEEIIKSNILQVPTLIVDGQEYDFI